MTAAALFHRLVDELDDVADELVALRHTLDTLADTRLLERDP